MMVKRLKAEHIFDGYKAPVKYDSKVNQNLKLRNKKKYWKNLAKISNSLVIQGSIPNIKQFILRMNQV